GAWVGLTAVAIASLTYLGASGATIGHSHSDTASVVADTQTHTDTTGGDGGVATALQAQGIDPGGSDASASVDPGSVPGALTQGSNGEANGGHHDHGKQPTFTQVRTMTDAQLLPMFPENTVSAADLPELKDQI